MIANLFNSMLNFLLSLLPHRVSVSCQIKTMEQRIHIGELISGTHTKNILKKKKDAHTHFSCQLHSRHLHQVLHSNLYFHIQNMAVTRFLFPLQYARHCKTASIYNRLLARMLYFKSLLHIQFQNCDPLLSDCFDINSWQD